jgi:Ca-activated chloride channel homolog
MVMKKLVIILYLTLISTHADAALNWQALWHTPDQQAQALLKQGKAKVAANTFVSPRHKAYAQLQAGEYAQAEKGFSQFKDADAYYNRGNAYAHMNQLPQALDAYEQALKLDPHNKDAVHNRDLVKQALKKQQKSDQQKQSQQDQNQQGKNQQSENKDKSQANKQQGNNQSGQNQENQQANSTANKDGNKSQQANAGQNANQKNQQGVTKPEQDKQAKTAQEQAQAKDSKEQAESDAKAGMAAQQAPSANANQQPQSAASEKNESASNASAESMAKNEQKMAQKQWLKQIPDDPSGLLRRKLLIEHLIRQGADAQ